MKERVRFDYKEHMLPHLKMEHEKKATPPLLEKTITPLLLREDDKPLHLKGVARTNNWQFLNELKQIQARQLAECAQV